MSVPSSPDGWYPPAPPGKDVNTFEYLVKVEKQRRRILQRTSESFWRILTHWKGTCLSLILKDGLFWTTMAIFIGIRIWLRLGSVPEFIILIANTDVTLIGGFLSFFVVYYVGECYGRFNAAYNLCMDAEGKIFDIATLAATNMPKESAQRLNRYLNAANIAAYTGLSLDYPHNTFFVELNKRNIFLTEEEHARMQEVGMHDGGSPFLELCTWAMNEIGAACRAGHITDPLLANTMGGLILGVRGALGGLFNAADQPIHFFYVHFISLLTLMYLPLVALSLSISAGAGNDVYWLADVVAGLTLILQDFYFIGLRLLGQNMTSPFGDDYEDLSVMHYVNFTWTMSNRILLSKFPKALDAGTEAEIMKNRVSVGHAWNGEKAQEPSIKVDPDEEVNHIDAKDD
eukprot:CAMPEP_0184711202 /NCGR_PEP_ID=MMETSP0314-20130426/1892_1 /TAXON_ID=38298 /ORGANISM="Rhodella maculata, Strain CCMP 736" /LENGTH=400 /DNA_ID=CAMNT_0027173249 /DNA_START=116 /DNA_END=1318 /DNA_ORIENTATION=-